MADFSEWSQKSLAKIADELNEENKELRQLVSILLDALRKEWINNQKGNEHGRKDS